MPLPLRQFAIPSIALAVAFVLHTAAAQSPPAPVAQWDFSEGAGVETAEAIGGGFARIHGATWVPQGDGFALRFDGIDDYVDGGAVPAARLDGPLTLETWVHPDQPATGEPGIFGAWFESFALTFYRGSCWFYIGSGANKVHAPLPVGAWSHIVATFDGTDLRLYINGEKAGRSGSTFDHTPPSEHITMGGIAPGAGTAPASYFPGMIGSARLYDRALDWKEAANRYNAGATAYGLAPVDIAQFDTLGLRLFPYPERGELVARVDYSHLTLPLERVSVQVALADESETPVSATLTEGANSVEVALGVPGNTAAALHCQATLLLDGEPVFKADAETPWIEPKQPVPDLATYRVPPLPPRAVPPAYACTLGGSGRISVKIDDEVYRVSSRFSYPHGGFNALGADLGTEEPEPTWSVAMAEDDESTVIGRGAFYRIVRRITRTTTRIEVTDTISNTGGDVLGVMSEHRLDGLANGTPVLNDNPTVFLAGAAHGMGMVPLDDVFFLRAENRLADGAPVLADRHLGIAPGGTHTVRWAIYPTAAPDYYDFINQVRADEGINGYVPGAFAFTSSWDVPAPEYVENRALGFYSWASITRVLQDPVVSLEGWEFTDYPALCDKIRTWIAATRAAYPALQTTFHVAHSLFATDQPEALFPDAVAMAADGSKICYGGNDVDYYNRYFAPELVEGGWRWWIFYPTMENSFGKRMLASADYMIQNLGATSVWADGYISGYVPGDFTYDHWDGVSVTIDPETKLVTAQKALVPYVALPVLKAVARMYTDAGGYLLTNGQPGPFSFTRLPVISSCETGGGDQQPISQLHLGSTVTPLGAPSAIQTFQDVYDDILRKLDLGALYFWYGEGDTVTEPTIVSEMYPITFESIHPGIVRGKERIVTKVEGVYGWPGSRDLHRVHFYDARGRKRPHGFVTTVDEAGVRTEIVLGEGESAVIEKLPVALDGEGAQNVRLMNIEPGRVMYATSAAPGAVREVAMEQEDGRTDIAAP